MEKQKTYPIEQIPVENRHMSHWDMFATWIGANANNGTWYIGGVVAACGLVLATKVLIASSALSYVLLSLVGLMGYITGVSTMALTRSSFGIRGSYVPSVINVVQFVGWTAVNTFIAATSLSILFHDFFGWKTYNATSNTGIFGVIVGVLVMSILHLISVSMGERSVQIIERIGIIFVIGFVIWESIVVFRTVSFHQLVTWVVPHSEQLKAGHAMDILAAFNLAWVTAGADFTRFTAKKGAATHASFWGALIGVLWFALIGVVSTISIAITSGQFNPNNSDPSTIANKLGLGVLAMIVIVLTSMTANAANLMAAASALNNLFHKIKLRKALWIITILATFVTFIPLIVGSFLDTFEAFLNYIGMILGPMIGIMITDFYVVHHQQYEIDELTKVNGKNWYHGGVNYFAFAIWIIGIVIYNLLQHVPVIVDVTGATFIAMIISGILYGIGQHWILQKRG